VGSPASPPLTCSPATGTPSPVEAFRAFALRQRDYLRYYQMVTWFLSPFFQSDYPILGWGRDVALPWLPRIPFVRKQMLMTVSGLKGGFTRGRVAV
jgi:2-polyprenyl-6-methoxyphenol hydroxylase-like FAD-dependent oxidoreductase